MQLGSLSLLLLLIGFFSCYPLVLGASEENAHSDSLSTESPNGCRGSATTVSAVVNASNNYMLDSIIVNCLAFSDNTSVVSLGIVSHRQGNTSARSTVICVNEILVVASSPNGFNDNETSCYQCRDMPDLSSCPNNAECSPGCMYCYGPSEEECLTCDVGRYNGKCVDMCPVGTSPNLDNGNECKCPGNFGGFNCTNCTLMSCPTTYYFNMEACECETCPEHHVYDLVDINAKVPESVIGHPLEEECYDHHEEEEEEEEFHLEDEDLICRESCTQRGGDLWQANEETHEICYACGINYCIDCNVNRCIKCREGTLLNAEGHCEGFYEEICVLAEEFEHEVEIEEEELKEYQHHLKISLPIVCVFVVFLFISFAIFAHFRYPHIGHAKRHRRPNEQTVKRTEFERTLRPQSTVIFR